MNSPDYIRTVNVMKRPNNTININYRSHSTEVQINR